MYSYLAKFRFTGTKGIEKVWSLSSQCSGHAFDVLNHAVLPVFHLEGEASLLPAPAWQGLHEDQTPLTLAVVIFGKGNRDVLA